VLPAAVYLDAVPPAQTTLPAQVTSVPTARRFVRESLRAVDAAAASAEAEMLVSELATNVVLHARTPFTIEVSRSDDTVRIGVLDASPRQPRVREYGTDATTGRGLRLLASLAVRWGVQAQGQGKVVWFELPAAGSTAEVPIWDDEELDVDALLAGFDDDAAEPVLRAAA
jgi:anti-sigma regulatory factor (Ser/Thr protein kinase)